MDSKSIENCALCKEGFPYEELPLTMCHLPYKRTHSLDWDACFNTAWHLAKCETNSNSICIIVSARHY